MKKPFFSLIIPVILCLAFQISAQPVGNYRKSIDLPEENLGSISKVQNSIVEISPSGDVWEFIPFPGNMNTGWIQFLNNGDTGYVEGSNIIFKTTDGGNTWIPTEIEGIISISAFVFNGDVGFLTGGTDDANLNLDTNKIFKTTDGGSTWTKVYEFMHTDYQIDELVFYDDNTIVGGGRDGGLFRTTDAGATWTRYQLGVGFTTLPGITLYNDTLFIVEEIQSNISGRLFKSSDGGANFQIQSNSLTMNWPFGVTIRNDEYIIHGTHFIWSEGFNTRIAKSTDGGVTFSPVSVPSLPGVVFGLVFKSEIEGYASGWVGVGAGQADGFVFRTSDGGNSWTEIHRHDQPTFFTAISNENLYFTGWQGIWKCTPKPMSVASNINIPDGFDLKQNYPNPFNPSTIIEFTLPKQGRVTLKIYDIAGTEIKTLIDDRKIDAGTVKHVFDDSLNGQGSNLASGIYFYTLIVDDRVIGAKKMLLVK
jgi:photosystem II stability/assembly factor-like uncharacterized protein